MHNNNNSCTFSQVHKTGQEITTEDDFLVHKHGDSHFSQFSFASISGQVGQKIVNES